MNKLHAFCTPFRAGARAVLVFKRPFGACSAENQRAEERRGSVAFAHRSMAGATGTDVSLAACGGEQIPKPLINPMFFAARIVLHALPRCLQEMRSADYGAFQRNRANRRGQASRVTLAHCGHVSIAVVDPTRTFGSDARLQCRAQSRL